MSPGSLVRTMSLARWALVVAAGAAALFSIVAYGLGGSARTAQIYHCPMHPAVVQDHPGECPICSMTLVPRLGASAPAPASAVPGLSVLDLTPERVQLIGMTTATVRREPLKGELRLAGVVTPDERRLFRINTRSSGWIEKVFVATGEHVTRGQVLATVYSPDILKAQEELLMTRGWKGDGRLAASARRRLELLGVSSPDVDQLLRAGKPPTTVAIRSPADGYLLARSAVAGTAVEPGTSLFEIADLSAVWVMADVYETDVSRVRLGQAARIEVAARPDETHTGAVSLVGSLVDAQSRALRIRIELPNPLEALAPGMYATVHLAVAAPTALVVPAGAVVETGDRHYVFVAKGGGHFEPRPVRTGAQAGGQVEILGGVVEGETVASAGTFLLDSESRLRAAAEGPP